MKFYYTLLQMPASNRQCFMQLRGSVNTLDYVAVWNDEIEADSEAQALDELFYKFNVGDRPAHYSGRSMSVSDIIGISTTTYPDRMTAYYVAPCGFDKLVEDADGNYRKEVK